MTTGCVAGEAHVVTSHSRMFGGEATVDFTSSMLCWWCLERSQAAVESAACESDIHISSTGTSTSSLWTK